MRHIIIICLLLSSLFVSAQRVKSDTLFIKLYPRDINLRILSSYTKTNQVSIYFLLKERLGLPNDVAFNFVAPKQSDSSTYYKIKFFKKDTVSKMNFLTLKDIENFLKDRDNYNALAAKKIPIVILIGNDSDESFESYPVYVVTTFFKED